MRRYKNYTDLVNESKKIDCCSKMENEIFPNIPDTERSFPTYFLDVDINYAVSQKLEALEIEEAKKTVKWFKKVKDEK